MSTTCRLRTAVDTRRGHFWVSRTALLACADSGAMHGSCNTDMHHDASSPPMMVVNRVGPCLSEEDAVDAADEADDAAARGLEEVVQPRHDVVPPRRLPAHDSPRLGAGSGMQHQVIRGRKRVQTSGSGISISVLSLVVRDSTHLFAVHQPKAVNMSKGTHLPQKTMPTVICRGSSGTDPAGPCGHPHAPLFNTSSSITFDHHHHHQYHHHHHHHHHRCRR
jgi:hypothetical protein